MNSRIMKVLVFWLAVFAVVTLAHYAYRNAPPEIQEKIRYGGSSPPFNTTCELA